ncbi:Protein CGR-1, partial [Aphelenchoides avenae]
MDSIVQLPWKILTHQCDHKSEKEKSISSGKQHKNGIANYVITYDGITDHQRSKICELRERLGKDLLKQTPLFDDDFSLLRWLMGWDYKFEEILPRFRRASTIFNCLNLTDLEFEDIDEINRHVRSLGAASEYYPGGIMSFDDDGNVVKMQCLGRAHPKSLHKCGRVSELYVMVITETALAYRLVKRQERKLGRKLGIRIVVDMGGFNMDHLYAPTIRIYINLLKMMQVDPQSSNAALTNDTFQDLFPDLARQVYVINAPGLFSAAFNLVKPALAEQSRDKIVFLASNFEESLLRDVGRENVLPPWGGTKKPPNGVETGTLRMGGVPPEEFRYNAEKNPFHKEDRHLTKVKVSAGTHREVKVQVAKAGQELRWFFTANSDVDFCVLKERL